MGYWTCFFFYNITKNKKKHKYLPHTKKYDDVYK